MLDLHDVSLYDVMEAVEDRLDGGPHRCSEIADDLLREEGLFDEEQFEMIRRGDVDLGELKRLVLEAVMDDEDVWASSHPDPVLALIEPFFDDLVLTHRLTAEEIAKGEVAITPDLTILDWDASHGLPLTEGGRMTHVRHRYRPGEDTSTFSGPPGWLSGFTAGDLVAFRRTGDLVRVTSAGPLDPDDHQVELLREASQRILRSDLGEEALVFVFDVLTVDPEAFRRPVRPVGELLEAAGLERRGFSFGPAGRDWKSAGERAQELQRLRLRRMFDLASCCEKAYDLVMDTVYTLGVPERASRDDVVTAEVGQALAHGWVAAGVAESALDGSVSGVPDWSEPVIDLATTLVHPADADPASRAAGRFLLAVDARRRGEALVAESLLRQALTDDPHHRPTARELAAFEVDRGELASAISLMERAGPSFVPQYELVEDLHLQIEASYRKAGRNQPCPCGSGRKFKACCLRARRLTPRLRGAVIDLKLLLFLRASDRHLRRLRPLVATVYDPRDPDFFDTVDETSNDPAVSDFFAFEGGAARDYLAERGALLPDEERELLVAALDEPRRLWEILDVGPGPYIVVGNAETGRNARVYDPIAAGKDSIGVLLLWRIVRHGNDDLSLGFQLEVEPEEEKAVRDVLDEGPTFGGLVRWYVSLD